MTLEEIVRTALATNAGLSALVGGNIFLAQLPQNLLSGAPFKAITYQRISTQRFYSHSGPADVGTSRFQFTAWAQSGKSSGADAFAIAFAIFTACKGFNASALPASPEVLYAAPNFVINQSMGIEPNTQPPIYKCLLDVQILFRDQ